MMINGSPSSSTMSSPKLVVVKERPVSGRSGVSDKSSPAAAASVSMLPCESRSGNTSAFPTPISATAALIHNGGGSLRSSASSRPLEHTPNSLFLRRRGSMGKASLASSPTSRTSGMGVFEERARLAELRESGRWCVCLTDAVLSVSKTSLELPQRALGSLPCLHAPPPQLGAAAAVGTGPSSGGDPSRSTPHGSGDALVSHVESLNLRNNSIATLTTRRGSADSNHNDESDAVGSASAPCSLSLFLHVTSIDITNNELVNLAGIEALPNLTSLRAARNSIGSLSSLWCSPHIGKLEYLDISANQLNEIMGEGDAAKMKARRAVLSLRTLAATDNGIRAISDTFRLFPALEVVKLRRNKIEAVAECFPACCPSLAVLDLHTNRLDEGRQIGPLRARTASHVALDVDDNTPVLESTPLRRSLPRSESTTPNTTSDESSSHHPSRGTRGRRDNGTTTAAAAVAVAPQSHNPDGAAPALTTKAAATASTTTTAASAAAAAVPVKHPPSSTLRQLSGAVGGPRTRQKSSGVSSAQSSRQEQQQRQQTPTAATAAAAAAAATTGRPPSPVPATRSASHGAEADATEPAASASAGENATAPGELQGVSQPSPNVWEVDVDAVGQQLCAGLAAGVARAASRGPPAAAAAWAGAPSLSLPYKDANVIASPPALALRRISAAATAGATCRVLIHFLLRAVGMERETMLARALKRYDEKRLCTGAACSAQPLAREPSGSGAGGGFPAVLVVDHTLVGAAAQVDNPWPYLRWRREFEAQAAARGVRVQNRFWLQPEPTQDEHDVRPVPELWEWLYADRKASAPAFASLSPLLASGRRGAAQRASKHVDPAAPGQATDMQLRVPAACDGCGGVVGTHVVWPVPLIIRCGAAGSAAAAALGPAKLAAPSPPLSSGSAILELAMGTLATNIRVRAEEEAELAEATRAQAVHYASSVYTVADIKENKRARLDELAAARETTATALASLVQKAGVESWESIIVDIPCASVPLAARQASTSTDGEAASNDAADAGRGSADGEGAE